MFLGEWLTTPTQRRNIALMRTVVGVMVFVVTVVASAVSAVLILSEDESGVSSAQPEMYGPFRILPNDYHERTAQPPVTCAPPDRPAA